MPKIVDTTVNGVRLCSRTSFHRQFGLSISFKINAFYFEFYHEGCGDTDVLETKFLRLESEQNQIIFSISGVVNLWQIIAQRRTKNSS